MLWLYQVSLPLTAVTSFALGVFVLCRNPRSRVNVIWFLMNMAVSAWAFGTSYIFSDDYHTALQIARLSNYAASLIAAFFVHFCLALVNKPGRTNKFLWIAYGYNLVLPCFLLTTPWFVPSVSKKMVFSAYADAGPLYAVYTALFFAAVIYGHSILLGNLKTQTTERRNQIKYVALATAIGFASGGPFFLLSYNIPVEPWIGHFLPLYPFVIAYAILKHQLMDITVVIRKSAIYSVLIACITATYLVFVVLAEKWLQGVIGYRSWAPSLVAAFVIALGFTPLKNWVQSFVDRYFFKGTQAAMAAENERLRHEVQHAEKLKAVSLLASGMAHEIKNPLATLKTFAEYLPAKYDDPDFRAKCARIIGQEVERIHAIVQQLLAFAKPAPPRLQAVSAAQVLEETLAFLQAALVKKQLRLTRNYTTPDVITADPAQLKQVFLNLLLNAIDATPPGGAITTQIIPNGRYLTVTIADTGCGIDPKTLPRLGEPFFTTKPHGTGLGLSVVHGIIEQHRGRINIESSSGTGTQVHLRLPVAKHSGIAHAA